MKNNRYEQAGILTSEQFEELLQHSAPKYRLLWSLSYYTACRISEALQLTRADIIDNRIIFRAETTKDKKTIDINISFKLAAILAEYPLPESGYIFPDDNGKHLSRHVVDLQLRKSCNYLGLVGISTHSFRRTSLTVLSRQ